ncbi:chemotaxis protein CheW [Desulfovibrio intestinalis]|uniref:Purine-binding chemotaxis protein CheW n=1 Tax=Desulfovibrio intestinalis TaxID=58621 RepID=A0A7W8C1R1_9BACT|nr:chemotaxis protein CheW [Desulfovibrio intestinalis]MBB5143978.1 purine-binding chemotaxis protein CheW [Desulfovibrio intestinalis]
MPMVKTPEEYFSNQCFAPPVQREATPSLSAAERAFVQKYLGDDAIANLPVQAPHVVIAAPPSPSAGPASAENTFEHTESKEKTTIPLKAQLLSLPAVQMVSFYVREQIFLLPVPVIIEVLRHMPLTRLPMAPSFVAGVVNLRGRVTPLLHLDALLTLDQQHRYTPQSFIVVCGSEQMQLGLIVDKIHTMYLLDQSKINWNAEAQLGASADLLCGLAEIDDHLHGIVDPEMIVEKLLEI